MSIDAFIFTRAEPVFGMQEHDVLNIEFVQILKPRRAEPDDWRRIGRAPDPSLVWLTDVNCASSAALKLEVFAHGLARRCGGGIWWCDLTNCVTTVPSQPDPGAWSLLRALSYAQNVESDLDEHDAMGGRQSSGHTHIPERQEDPELGEVRERNKPLWDIAVAKRGDANAWIGQSGSVKVFALLEGHGGNGVGGAALSGLRTGFDIFRGNSPANPIEQRFLGEPLSSLLNRLRLFLEASVFEKRFLRGRPRGWGTVAIARTAGDRLAIAHVGDSRAYRLSSRGVEQLTTEQLSAPPSPGQHAQPATAIGPGLGAIQDNQREVVLQRDDRIVLLSFEVWSTLGPALETTLMNATKWAGVDSSAREILEAAPTATCGAVVVGHFAGIRPRPTAPRPIGPRPSDLPLFLLVRDCGERALIGRKFEVPPSVMKVTIGSDRENTLEVRSAALSPQHARFEWRGDAWYVVDLGSTTGTYVDEARVTDSRVGYGQPVRLGDTVVSLVELIVETHYKPTSTDGLTGLANKQSMLERITAAHAHHARPSCVIRIDVDRLKLINEVRGHEAGDKILAHIGAALREGTRDGELAGRIGADDFVVLCEGAELAAILPHAEQLRAQLSQIVPVSVGTTQVARHLRDAQEVIFSAEQDLHARRAASR